MRGVDRIAGCVSDGTLWNWWPGSGAGVDRIAGSVSDGTLWHGWSGSGAGRGLAVTGGSKAVSRKWYGLTKSNYSP